MAIAFVQLMAFSCTAMGSLFLYLSAPRQQWLEAPWPPLSSRIAGAALLVIGLLLWSVATHPVTAIFTSLTVTMTLLIVLPFASALPALLRRP